MGLRHQRAICPNCGGKIHTHTSNPFSVVRKTGNVCQHCGAKLTGKVTLQNRGVLADPTPAPND